ncbi:MAG: helix-turn-helix domain-containing protein, partial [Desulfobacterales bacterium]|nr:helix-turn-helix domain-containing protein [Desulfobacterales bacterium]
MTTEKKSLSFGRYLQDIRLSKGISLETVAEETRIRIDNLLLIEGENHDKLPDEVFVKGFVRAFAKAIGA